MSDAEIGNLTVQILREIRDGITSTREDLGARLDTLGEKVDQLGEKVGQLDTRMGRVESGLNDLGQFLRQIALAQAKHETFHAHHVEIIEKDVDDLRLRVRRLEER